MATRANIAAIRRTGRAFAVSVGTSTRGEGDNKARRGAPARRGFF